MFKTLDCSTQPAETSRRNITGLQKRTAPASRAQMPGTLPACCARGEGPFAVVAASEQRARRRQTPTPVRSRLLMSKLSKLPSPGDPAQLHQRLQLGVFVQALARALSGDQDYLALPRSAL